MAIIESKFGGLEYCYYCTVIVFTNLLELHKYDGRTAHSSIGTLHFV